MKKFITMLLLAGVLCLTACGSKEKVIEGEGQATEAGGDGQEASQAGSTGKGYTFSANGATIGMDVDAAPILEKLGEPASYFEAASCAFEGLDKMYTYSGFELDTYPAEDGKDLVSAVILKDDSVSTPEGVSIGDAKDKVSEAYGDGFKEDGDALVYEKDGMKLSFIMQDDAVASIEYRSTVLDNQ